MAVDNIIIQTLNHIMDLSPLLRTKLSLIASTLLVSTVAQADLTLTQSMSFGTVAVIDNSSTQNITIDEFGNFSISSGLRTLDPGMPAIFEASNFPGNLQLFITPVITRAGTSSDVFSPEQFTLTNLYVASSVITGADGRADIIVGGRMETSGSGSTNFVDTNYESTLSITINY